MRAKEVLKILRIARSTLAKYVKEGKIRVKVLPNGRYDYYDEDVWRLAGSCREERLNVIYARVSTAKQRGDLERQVKLLENYCIQNGVKIDKVFKDIGSGIELEKRKEFMKLFELIKDYRVNTVFITYRDRLSRIGFNFLEKVFESYGTKIVVVNESKFDDEKLAEKEIFKELISIIHSFAMRLYSNRRKKMKLKYCEEELKLADKHN
jgi:predicted site-specific integrase-resolvase